MGKTGNDMVDALEEKEELTAIEFGDDRTYKELKLAYHAAITNEPPLETFVFRGHVLLQAWAKYAIIYGERMRKRAKMKYFDAEKRQWKPAWPAGKGD